MSLQAEQYLLIGVLAVCVSAVVAISLILNRPLPDAIISAGVQIVTAIVSYLVGKRSSNGSGSAT